MWSVTSNLQPKLETDRCTVWTMAVNFILISQISGYSISLILSLCMIIPMSKHQEEFRYLCSFANRLFFGFCFSSKQNFPASFFFRFEMFTFPKLIYSNALILIAEDTVFCFHPANGTKVVNLTWTGHRRRTAISQSLSES